MSQGLKRCEVAYALPGAQFIITVTVPLDASVADVLAAAQTLSARTDIPWASPAIGIYGERCLPSHRPLDGDRVEIYRPLERDPRRARREAAEQARRSARRRSGG
jgi:putative ubiquitin-RnfH superfamily antitoxin RatB of RatAB toxin-antitoxin module